MDIFSDLKKLGIGNIGDVFEEENKENADTEVKKEKSPEEIEAEMLFDKSYKCIVCDKAFTVKAVRAGKAKMVATDTDLRAIYAGVDVNKYDAIVCPHCGYAALTRFFEHNTQAQRNLIREQISASFKGLPPQQGITINYDEAFLNMKLVLANAVVKKAKNSEKAYICLKMAWILRGKREWLKQEGKLGSDEEATLLTEELSYIKQAYLGFSAAVSKENFPICGMDDMTLIYIMADLARKIGETDQALRFLGEIIVSKTAKSNLKDKARELKDIIMEERK
ncbi:MAG: DUF2225 domain-containing protein [Lachnospiraceae bacterium]|nr:DUF2225 domain-containing protein [Lachnospiraceae bacterium]